MWNANKLKEICDHATYGVYGPITEETIIF